MRIVKFIGLLSITFLLSCSGNKPETTVNDFFAAISDKDFDKAKSLATEKSKSTLNFLESGIEISFGDGILKNIDCVTENEIATCDCFMEGKEKPIPLTVVQENGEWKVDVQLTTKNMMNNFLDKLNVLDLSGIDLKNLDIKGVLKNIGGSVETGTNKLNEFLKNIDTDKISKTLKGLDSNLEETSGNIEELLKKFEEGMGETE